MVFEPPEGTRDISGGDCRVDRCCRLGTRRQSGQVFPVMLFGLFVTLVVLMMAFNSSLLTFRKTDLVNAADAAAYSGGVQAARSLNFMAYTNRAMVANTIAVGYLVSFVSYLRYLGDLLNQVSTPRQFLAKVLMNNFKSGAASFENMGSSLDGQNPMNGQPNDGAYDGIYTQGNPDQTGAHAIGAHLSEFGKKKHKGIGSALQAMAGVIGFSTVGPVDMLNAFYAGTEIATYGDAKFAIDDTIQQVAQSYNENIRVKHTTSSNFYKWIIPMRPGLDRPPVINYIANKAGRKLDEYLSQSVSVSPFGAFSNIPGIKQIVKGIGAIARPFTDAFGWTKESVDAHTKDFDVGLMKQFIYNSMTIHDAWWIFFNRGWRLCLPTIVCLPPILPLQFALDKVGATELFIAARPTRKSPFGRHEKPGGGGSDHGSNGGHDDGGSNGGHDDGGSNGGHDDGGSNGGHDDGGSDGGSDNWGDNNEGNNNWGDNNKGDNNWGDNNKGDNNWGKDNKGDNNWGDNNEGNDNIGNNNKGDNNKGDNNKGDNNWGKDNEGKDNQGKDNEGDNNRGDNNKGDNNWGKDNKGDNNWGDNNEGNNNVGNNNKGDNNWGDNNKGDNNWGNDNEGDNNWGNDNEGDNNVSINGGADRGLVSQRPRDQGFRYAAYRMPDATDSRSGLIGRNTGMARNTGIWIVPVKLYDASPERTVGAAIFKGEKYAGGGYNFDSSVKPGVSARSPDGQRPWDRGTRYAAYLMPGTTEDRSDLIGRNTGMARNGVWIAHAGPYYPSRGRSVRSAVYRPASSAHLTLVDNELSNYTGGGGSLPNYNGPGGGSGGSGGFGASPRQILNMFHPVPGGTIAEQANRRMARSMTVIQRSFGGGYRSRMRSMKAKTMAFKAAAKAAGRGLTNKVKQGLKSAGRGSMKFNKLLKKYLYPRNSSLLYGANWVAGDVLSNGLFDNPITIGKKFAEWIITFGQVDAVADLRFHLYPLAQGEASAKEFFKPYQGVPMYFMLAEVPFSNIHAPMKIHVTLKLPPNKEGLLSKLGFDGSQSRAMQASATAKLFYYRQRDDDQNEYFKPVVSGPLQPLAVYLYERPVLNRLSNWYGRDAVVTAFWGNEGDDAAVVPVMKSSPDDYAEFDNVFNPFWEVRLAGQ